MRDRSAGTDAGERQLSTVSTSKVVIPLSANFGRCDDPNKKTACSQVVRNKAPGDARAAALNGNCAVAKAIILAAQNVGASSPKLGSALAGSSCK